MSSLPPTPPESSPIDGKSALPSPLREGAFSPLDRVVSYLASCGIEPPLHDHRFHLPAPQYRRFLQLLDSPLQLSGLSGRLVDSLRHDYNASTATLTIRGMPTPVHDCFGEFICMCAGDMRATGFLTKVESRSVIVRCGSTDHALPSSGSATATGTPGGKAVGIVKQPDVALQVRRQMFPRIVFEVGFTQTYESLREDCRQWLIRSAGRVTRMFLVKIEEDDRVRRPEGVEDDDAIGGMAEEARVKSMLLGSDDSTPDAYDELFENITVEDWVGKLTAFIEEYRYDSASRAVVMHGNRIYLLRTDEGVEDSEALDYIASPLTLHIEDIFPDVNDGRRFELPLQDFCEQLEMSRRELAVIRYLRWRKNESGLMDDRRQDPDYV
ncbi:hypothetical protein K440DRAFT_626652 [Wilcoxina mikolae CBS 423.85]|nr:hypothetical protein K440DRAFT_626652 [Wilcoxina mikolae CBS 423.85]